MSIELTCSAILFDMDGTLIDSGNCVERQWARWADRQGIPLENVLSVSHGRRTIETMRLLAPHLNQPDELDRFLADEASDLDDVRAFDGAAALLESLPADRWALVTSSAEAVARARLEHCRLPSPAVLIAADHVQNGKPHPEPWLTAARRLGVPPERCLVVEDANSGIQAATAAGMQVIGAGWSREKLLCRYRIQRLSDLRLRLGNDLIVTIPGVPFTFVPPQQPVPFDRITAAAVIPWTKAGQFVAVMLSRGIDIPGGHVEPGEQSIEAVIRREAVEEAGIEVGALSMVGYLQSEWGYVAITTGRVTEFLPFAAKLESKLRVTVTPAEFLDRYTAGDYHIMRLLITRAAELEGL